MHKCWGRKLTKNKAVEASVMGIVSHQISFGISLRFAYGHCDHAGIYFSLEFLNAYVEINIYDVRHREDY